MLISVVVPVYKVEKYLNRCVDSILNQTFADFELILVDDGSPDNCGKICEIIIPGPGKYLGCLCRDYEYCIPWVKILKIGPDIVLVDMDEEAMRRKI